MLSTSPSSRSAKSEGHSNVTGPKGLHDISPLEVHIGFWLRLVSNHVSHGFKLKLQDSGTTVAEWVVMRALFDRSGIKPSELSDIVGLSRGAISKLLDRLSSKGLIQISKHAQDQRSQQVSLTPAGQDMVPRLAAIADQNDSAAFGHLEPQQRSALMAILTDLANHHNLSQPPLD